MSYQKLHPNYRELEVDGSLRLLEPSLKYAAESLSWVSSLDVVQYMGADFPSPSLEGEQKRIEEILSNKDEYSWMIEYEKKIIGNVCINSIAEATQKHAVRTGNLTVLIGDKDYWGQGIGLKACSAVIAWAFDSGGFQRMTARALQENVASIKTLERLRFKEAGTEPYEGLVRDKKSEWKNFILNKLS